MRSIIATAFLLLLIALPAQALVPNDPLYERLWFLRQVDAPSAWDVQTGSSDVIVAVIDSGVDLNHPDLAGNLWKNPGEIAGDGRDNDGNGYVDDVYGWDFYDRDADPSPYTDDPSAIYEAITHGTAVAGVIGGVGNNDEGIAGINWRTRIMSLRVLGPVGGGDSGDVARAIRYATDMGADVINLSFVASEDIDPGLRSAVREAYEAGVVVVAAVGNIDGGVDLATEPQYPACYSLPGREWVIAVSSSDQSDARSSFSNYGSCANIAAPGEWIVGAVYQDPASGFPDPYGQYFEGTSLAAPMVSGAAALLLSAYPSLTPTQVRVALLLSADPVRNPDGKPFGAGRLNVARALELAGTLAPAAPVSPILPGPAPEAGHVVAVAGVGARPSVHVFDPSGVEKATFDAYAPGFLGGVRVALGDVDGDGAEEIVTVPGPGGGPHVRVFELDGQLRGQFFAGDTNGRTGLSVAAGDADGDGRAEIAISEDRGGDGTVRLYRLDGSVVGSLVPFGVVGDLRVTLADADGDGRDEIVTARGKGLAPLVRVHELDGTERGEFLAYAEGFLGGVFLSAGDVDGDGVDEIVVAPGAGGGPHVRALHMDGSVVTQFFAFDPGLRTGARAAAMRLGGLGAIASVPGPGAPMTLRAFSRSGERLLETILPSAASSYEIAATRP